MLDPSMQIFYLTDQCNNACSFCICKRHIRERLGDSPSTIKKKLQALPQDGIVDIYGGEPTLSRHFMEIIRQAKQKHCFINIASNARSFSDKNFLEEFVKETEDHRDRIFIRSSLHGHTAALHERHTRRKNSFKEAIDGIRRLKKAGYRMSVNTVITRHNIQNLREIHRLIDQYDVDVFKLSFLRYTIRHIGLAVSLDDLKKMLPKTLQQVANSKTAIDLDCIPYCVAPAQLALYAKEEHNFIENDNRVVKPDQCAKCSMVGMCPGVDREYFELFGGKELKPISRRHMDRLQTKPAQTP
jgi:MoaA/NifB/PqqE/SkfB family radical SAM enzyme